MDITNVARAFTGWTIVGPNNPLKPFGTYQFVERIHDTGQKQVLNLTIPAGGGEDDGTKVLDMLAHHPMAAQFISTKLARHFVSDSPDPALVSDLTNVFTQSDGDTPTLLKAIFQSDAFKNSAGQKMKRPLDFLASTLRLTNATLTGQSQQLTQHVKLLGQIPFDWQFPNGFPDVASFWATTSGLLAAEAVRARAGVGPAIEILHPETMPPEVLAALKLAGMPSAYAAKAMSVSAQWLRGAFREVFPRG